MKTIRNNTKIIGHTKIAPIICFQGGKKLGKILVKVTIPEKNKYNEKITKISLGSEVN
jgi:hypothetical protein